MGLLSCFPKVIKRPFNNNKKPEREINSWSFLPDDIVRLILERLSYSDQIRCRAVCKSWKSNICGIKCTDKLPWIFTYRRHLCFLYDPCHHRKYTIFLKKFALVGTQLVASNFGWLLFSKPCYSTRCLALFFYNPFTDEIINLSSLPFKGLGSERKILFSENPTYPNCVIFSVWLSKESFLIIETCCRRDATWAIHSFVCFDYGYNLGISYWNGILYCVFSNGTLGAFHAATKEWKIYPQQDPQSHYGYHNLIIDSEGNLFLINMYEWLVFSFDWYQMKWIETTKSLANKMLFIDSNHKQCNFILSVGEESHELVNTVHYCNLFLSFYFRPSSNRRIPVPAQPYTNFWREHPGGQITNIWIQPPQI